MRKNERQNLDTWLNRFLLNYFEEPMQEASRVGGYYATHPNDFASEMLRYSLHKGKDELPWKTAAWFAIGIIARNLKQTVEHGSKHVAVDGVTGTNPSKWIAYLRLIAIADGGLIINSDGKRVDENPRGPKKFQRSA